MAFWQKPAFLLIAALLVSGCIIPQKTIPATPAPENNDFAPPEAAPPAADCLGITAEKMQQACGSGPLIRTVSPITGSGYTGYYCSYYAIDTEGKGPGTFVEDELVLSEQAAIKYYTGGDVRAMKTEVQEVENPDFIADTQDGFYAVKETDLHLAGTKGQYVSVWAQNGDLLVGLFGGSLTDYPLYGFPRSMECSTEELFSIRDFVAGRTTTIQPYGEIPQPPPGQNETGEPDEECPCVIMVGQVDGEVDVEVDGEWKTAEKGQVLGPGDKIATGENSQIVLYFYNCDFAGAEGVRDEVAIIGSSSLGELGEEDGKQTLSVDPGVTISSVKQYPQFQTDFQVSTPRDCASVRG